MGLVGVRAVLGGFFSYAGTSLVLDCYQEQFEYLIQQV
jgi:hypothetical protein